MFQSMICDLVWLFLAALATQISPTATRNSQNVYDNIDKFHHLQHETVTMHTNIYIFYLISALPGGSDLGRTFKKH